MSDIDKHCNQHTIFNIIISLQARENYLPVANFMNFKLRNILFHSITMFCSKEIIFHFLPFYSMFVYREIYPAFFIILITTIIIIIPMKVKEIHQIAENQTTLYSKVKSDRKEVFRAKSDKKEQNNFVKSQMSEFKVNENFDLQSPLLELIFIVLKP